MEGILYRFALSLAAKAVACLLVFASPAQALEAYLFRGAGDFSFLGKGLTFSNGMDRLGEKLTAAGVPAKVYRWESMEFAYRDIMKRRPDAVMIMGHSMGALSTVNLASRLKGSGVRVAYIGTIDIPGPAAVAPANVEVAENFYHAFPVYGMLSGGPGFKGELRNQYVFGEIHITMDKSKKVHAAALDFVGRSRGTAETMQAYAPEPAAPDLIAQVDSALASSVAVSSSDPQTIVAASSASWAAQMLPAEGPAPVRAPRRYATESGLPPVE